VCATTSPHGGLSKARAFSLEGGARSRQVAPNPQQCARHTSRQKGQSVVTGRTATGMPQLFLGFRSLALHEQSANPNQVRIPDGCFIKSRILFAIFRIVAPNPTQDGQLDGSL